MKSPNRTTYEPGTVAGTPPITRPPTGPLPPRTPPALPRPDRPKRTRRFAGRFGGWGDGFM